LANSSDTNSIVAPGGFVSWEKAETVKEAKKNEEKILFMMFGLF
jgi:hypothetical protein